MRHGSLLMLGGLGKRSFLADAYDAKFQPDYIFNKQKIKNEHYIERMKQTLLNTQIVRINYNLTLLKYMDYMIKKETNFIK